MAGYKLIVSNKSALENKYGPGMTEIQNAIDALIAADNSAGITSRILYLDDAATMGAIRVPHVTDSLDDQQNKDAIDAVIKEINKMMKFLHPGTGPIDCLLLLGSVDIIPQQTLQNPMRGDNDDDFITSDLPYACDSPYSRQIKDFLNPILAVGRLPDLTGTPDTNYFVDVITHAANRVAHSASHFHNYFAVSSADVESSTVNTLMNLFGSANVEVCPPKGCSGIAICPKAQSCPGQTASGETCPPGGIVWTAAQMAAYTHYFNFHGISRSAASLGAGTIPMHAGAIINLSAGMVAAHAGCYGAELFDPRNTVDKSSHPGLCNTYLRKGCAAYFGSTTSSYGRPRSLNTNANLITELFLKHLLQGSSSGLACLKARRDFIKESDLSLPRAMKTIAQFTLMGDPSLTPVKVRSFPQPPVLSPPGNLHLSSMQLRVLEPDTAPIAQQWSEPLPPGNELPAEVENKIAELAAQHPGVAPAVRSFSIRRSEGEPAASAAGATHVHTVCFNYIEGLNGSPGMRIPRSVAYEILEKDGVITDVID